MLIARGIAAAVAVILGLVAIWPWISTLNEGEGAFLGAFSGLVAILIGAFVNAELNRRRDDRLRNETIEALRDAVRAEIRTIRRTAVNRRGVASQAMKEQHLPDPLGADTDFIQNILRMPPPLTFQSRAGDIGLLGHDAANDVFHFYGFLATLQGEIDMLNAGTSRNYLSVINNLYQMLIEQADQALTSLETK